MKKILFLLGLILGLVLVSCEKEDSAKILVKVDGVSIKNNEVVELDCEGSLVINAELSSTGNNSDLKWEIKQSEEIVTYQEQSDMSITVTPNDGSIGKSVNVYIRAEQGISFHFSILIVGPDNGYVINNGVWEIYTEEGLRAFATTVNEELKSKAAGGATCSIDAKLMQSIKFEEPENNDEGNWEAIGFGNIETGEIYSYSGTFDGNGKAIEGLKIYNFNKDLATQINYNALFGCLTAEYDENNNIIKRGEVKNLKIVNPSVSTNINSAALVAYAKDAIISKCSTEGGFIRAYSYTGGIVGRGVNVEINECVNTALVETIITHNSGGIAGHLENFKLLSCYSAAKISTLGINIGGIVGFAKDGIIVACSSNDRIFAHNENVGGLAGIIENVDIVGSYSSATIKISTKSENVGGLIGKSVDNSGNTELAASYFCGEVETEEHEDDKDYFIGGVIGYSENAATMTIEEVYWVDIPAEEGTFDLNLGVGTNNISGVKKTTLEDLNEENQVSMLNEVLARYINEYNALNEHKIEIPYVFVSGKDEESGPILVIR